MNSKRSLRSRIALSFVLFGAVVSSTLSVGLFVAMKTIETSILDDTLAAELTDFHLRAASAPPRAFHSRTTTIHIAALGNFESIPHNLRNLPPGNHNVSESGQDYRVLIEDTDDARYYVVFNDKNIHRRERAFAWSLWLVVILAIIVSAIIGYWLSRRVISPVTRLASDVERLEPTGSPTISLSDFSDDEVGRLAQKVLHFHQQLAELLEREKEFAGNVSHELRTPVTIINLATEVLVESPSIRGKDRACINRIQRAAKEIRELVETFLVLAQVERNRALERGSSEVNAIVREVLESQAVWLRDKRIIVTFDEATQLEVQAPPRVVAVLVSNLVRNAFRYTERGSVCVTVANNRLSIQDSGPGIDDETKSRMFERHVQGKVGTTDGVGLGLAIARRICERYHWQITFESTEGEGTRFDVNFSPADDGDQDHLT